VIEEEGSDLARRLWNSAYPGAASVLVYPEARAALAAARRSGRLAGAAYARALEEFEGKYEDLATVGVDAQLVQSAGDRAESFGLRGYDAVHLATALALSEEEVVVVTWDGDLSHAAESAGLAVAGA
jgi:predicted nucleic acid-binding protein